ncbi:heterokaryon incompatibility protein-domain-containing protein [Hypoxylon sp. NC1633]|nr:heterokaryon incompatibility protein-domain-containing protein [Hypoxylon sp. NC1633]
MILLHDLTMRPGSFQYTPLNRSTCSIRLLRFLPSSAAFDCLLEPYEIDDCPPYIALSYVWGTDEPTHQIWLNQRVFFVRDNLWHALSRLTGKLPLELRNKQQDRYFWIDALCINQDDLLERGHQVDLMGLIFSNAYVTIAWLGLAKDESDFAVENLATNLHNLNEDDISLFDQNNLRDDMNRTIKSLLSRDYFSRMWVVQEILLAQDVLILCGSKCRFWHYLSHYAGGNLTLEKPFKPSIPNAAQALITARNNLMLKKDSRPSLASLIMRFGAGKCSDVRDRVYGLLGLIRATNPHSTMLQADYTISTVQVYCRAMAFMQSERILLPQDPWYFEEVSTALANALELPRSSHQSISIMSTIVLRSGYEIKSSGSCAFSELLHRCILPLEVICNIKLTSPFDYNTKYKEVIRTLDFFPVGDNPKMWSDFEESLGSILRIWCDYICRDPEMKQIPSKLSQPKVIRTLHERLREKIRLLAGQLLSLRKIHRS